MKKKNYLENYIEPSLASWGAASDTIFLSPIKVQSIDIKLLDWSDVDSFSHSEILWFYSLGALVKAYFHNKSNINIQLKSFLAFQLSEENKYLYDQKYNHSFDHCVAVRIRYLCALLAADYPNRNLVLDIIANDLKWFGDIKSIPFNNHGMMVCIAVLHTSLFIHNDEMNELVGKASNILMEIISFIVPSNYYVNENTVGYHEYYVKSLRSLLRFILDFNVGEELVFFIKNIVSKLEETLFKIVWPCGGIPPIGQCGAYKTKHTSIAGRFLFSPQGFFVFKNERNYLSYTCGYANTIHKQVDDTSLTLRINDEDIFVDCGLGTYDSKDIKAVVINGQRGHSGAFFRKFDYLTMWEFYSSGKIESLEYELEEKQGSLHSSKKFQHSNCDYSVRRILTIIDFNNLIVTDKFITDDSFASPVSRFLIPIDVKVVQIDNRIILKYKAYDVAMECMNPFSLVVLPSFDYGHHTSSAFASDSYGKYKEVQTVEILALEYEMCIKISISKS